MGASPYRTNAAPVARATWWTRERVFVVAYRAVLGVALVGFALTITLDRRTHAARLTPADPTPAAPPRDPKPSIAFGGPGQREEVPGRGSWAACTCTPGDPLCTCLGDDGLSSDEIAAVASEHQREVKRDCGRMGDAREVVRLTIAADGHVAKADAEGDNDAVGSCLQKELRAWRFPPKTRPTGPVSVPFGFIKRSDELKGFKFIPF